MEFSLVVSDVWKAPGSIVGITKGSSPTTLVVTIDSIGVYVVDSSKGDSFLSWGVKPSSSIVAAAVWHSYLSSFAAVLDNKCLCLWKEDDLGGIDDCKVQIEFPSLSKLTSLLSGTQTPYLYLVREDASVVVINSVEERVVHECPKERSRVVLHAELCSGHGKERLFMVTAPRRKGPFSFDIHEANEDGRISKWKSFKISPPNEGDKIVNISYFAASRCVGLVWSSGSWEVIRLPSFGSVSSDMTTVIQRQVSYTIEDILLLRELAVIIGVEDTGERRMRLCDIHYGVEHSSEVMENTSDNRMINFVMHQNLLFSACHEDLWMVNVHAPPVSLACVLAKETMKTDNRHLSVYKPRSVLKSAVVNQEMDVPVEWESKGSKLEDKVLRFIDDTKNVGNEKELLQMLTSKRGDEKSSAVRMRMLSQSSLRLLCENCIEKQYWKVLRLLIRKNVLTCMLSSPLLNAAMEHQQLDLLTICFSSMKDIPEEEILKCLIFCLRRNCGECEEDATLLSSIISCACNENLLRKHLRQLPEQELQLLLDICVMWLTQYHNGDLPKYIDMSSVFHWISIILDCFGGNLSISRDIGKRIYDIYEFLSEETAICDSLDVIPGMADIILRRCQLAQPAASSYSVELCPIDLQNLEL